MSSKKGETQWKGYLSYSLVSSDKKSILAAGLALTDMWDWLQEMVDSGVSISITTDTKSSGYRMSATGKTTRTIFDGYTVSSWGKELSQCLAVIHYLFTSGKYGEWLEGLVPIEDDDWYSP